MKITVKTVAIRPPAPPNAERVIDLPDGAMVAGSWLIQHREGAWHTQYLACAEAGRPMRAQDVLMDALVSHFRDEGAQTLSFGACTEDEGRTVNDGLLTFKTKFGGGAVTAATFRFAL